MSTPPTAIDEALAANRRFAATYDRADLPRAPRRRLAVVACLDTRVQPYEMLGIAAGDAHIIRNAGAVVTEDVMRSLLVSRYVGGTREWMIMGHTKCGMTAFRDEDLLAEIEAAAGRPAFSPTSFHTFPDVAASVRREVEKVRHHPWMPGDVTVRGFVVDVTTGRLEEVAPQPPPEPAATPPGRTG